MSHKNTKPALPSYEKILVNPIKINHVDWQWITRPTTKKYHNGKLELNIFVSHKPIKEGYKLAWFPQNKITGSQLLYDLFSTEDWRRPSLNLKIYQFALEQFKQSKVFQYDNRLFSFYTNKIWR